MGLFGKNVSNILNEFVNTNYKQIKIPKENNIQEQGLILLTESSNRAYKCPYCSYHDTRENLVFHVKDNHQDMIPEGYTPARVVFNYLNKKDHGTCIIDGAETKWREDVWRYDRICKKESCHKKYNEMIDQRMINKFGKRKILDDDEQQKKMLANRRISGTYKFKDGGVHSYCGSYEQKLLEFFDTVLQVPSKDVMTPGPTIEYEYKGQTLKWITDVFYVPFNLVMDVKDGGKNPNNRPMEDYRAKQVAKERAIAKLGTFNYLRLTDNNFEQLLFTMSKIKKQLTDYPDSDDVVIDINEMTSTAGALPPNTADGVYLLPYMMDNSFIGTCISTDKYLDSIYRVNDDKIVKEDISFLFDYNFSIFKYVGENTKEIINKLNEYHMDINKPVIESSYVLNKDDIYINFDKWKKDSSNILFITGLSGSGKTTLAEDFEKKYNAEMFEIDGLEHVYDSSKSKIFEKVKKAHPEYAEHYNEYTKLDDNTKFISLLQKMTNYIIKEMQSQKDKLFIIEGIQIFEWIDPNILKSKPVIIKGTSMTNSILQRLKRDGEGKINWIKVLKKKFPQLCKWYKDENKLLNTFTNDLLKESYRDFFYTALTGKELLSYKQISYDENFVEIENPYNKKINRIRSIMESINYQALLLNEDNKSINLLSDKDLILKESLLKDYNNIDIKQDINGYFVCNEITNCRSKSYQSIEDIDKNELSIIESMKV